LGQHGKDMGFPHWRVQVDASSFQFCDLGCVLQIATSLLIVRLTAVAIVAEHWQEPRPGVDARRKMAWVNDYGTPFLHMVLQCVADPGMSERSVYWATPGHFFGARATPENPFFFSLLEPGIH